MAVSSTPRMMSPALQTGAGPQGRQDPPWPRAPRFRCRCSTFRAKCGRLPAGLRAPRRRPRIQRSRSSCTCEYSWYSSSAVAVWVVRDVSHIAGYQVQAESVPSVGTPPQPQPLAVTGGLWAPGPGRIVLALRPLGKNIPASSGTSGAPPAAGTPCRRSSQSPDGGQLPGAVGCIPAQWGRALTRGSARPRTGTHPETVRCSQGQRVVQVQQHHLCSYCRARRSSVRAAGAALPLSSGSDHSSGRPRRTSGPRRGSHAGRAVRRRTDRGWRSSNAAAAPPSPLPPAAPRRSRPG